MPSRTCLCGDGGQGVLLLEQSEVEAEGDLSLGVDRSRVSGRVCMRAYRVMVRTGVREGSAGPAGCEHG